MTAFYWLMIVLLKLLLVAGLVRVALGPTPPDRLSAAMLLGTAGTAILLLLSQATEAPALVDTALVLVLLATVGSAALWRFGADH